MQEETENQPLFIEIDKEGFINSIDQHFESKIIELPSFYNPIHPIFLGKSHLFSIYQDSYLCILCGLYHPGIMLMGQLFEMILKEIILIYDGVNDERPLESMIKYAKNEDNKKRPINGPLLPLPILDLFTRVKDNIRNPYMHLNYAKIFGDEKIRGFKFPSGATFDELIENSQKAFDKLNKGEIKLVDIDPVVDKIIADTTKRDNDAKWAIEWAWELFPLFEMLIDEYLTEDQYEKYAIEHKGDYDTIPSIELD
ncbi:hypothetical protein [Methanospirillum lacunae]|uniref:Uncharacterized protein n=1 Tax=Methanospirillum lacunae TaxID=668570 RepID=A0A2V2N379_9EURY|nr:hypothetical protein [Methanospirillum lacunae]PWR72176.1 hypothetical protein DK846_09320 [Methanospirillum lacunae]